MNTKTVCIILGVFTLFCSYGVVSGLSERCKEGRNYWCKNDETAKECGAINLCIFENQSNNKDNKINFQTERPLDAPPVNVTLYYESLCPDCKLTIQQQIYPTFQKLANTDILNVNFVPYGNAQERAYGNQWIFYCQHGQAECVGNLIETCFLHYYPNQNQYMPFIRCVEYYGPTSRNALYCAGLQKLNYEPVSRCVSGAEGNALQHQMALKTNALNPPHQYVPWFTMNGYHSTEIQNQLSTNMLAYVCDMYTGVKPNACSQRKRIGASYREQ